MVSILPFIIYYIAALLPLLIKGKMQKGLLIVLSVLAFINIVLIVPQRTHVYVFSGFEVVLHLADSVNLFLGYIFSFITVIVTIFTINTKSIKHFIFMYIYVGSAFGILFSGDFLSFFLFWEVMMIAAVVLISFNREVGALKSAFRYLIIHLAGGGILFAGILLNYHYTGSMELKILENTASAYLILIGIGVNAAFIPLHVWLPDAYSKSPVTTSLVLSVFTTKIAVYSLTRFFPGLESLIVMGAVMALFGSVYACFKTNIRQILSYLIISSLGFMLTGIGTGDIQALNASMLFAWNHIIYNALLFMCVAAVNNSTGKQDLTELQGIIHSMPLVSAGLISGALATSGFPLFNGFISKVLIFDSLQESGIYYILLKISAFFIAYAMIRMVYYVVFNKSIQLYKEVPKHMTIMISILSAVVAIGGVAPRLITPNLPYNPEVLSVLTYKNISESLIVIAMACIVFFASRRYIIPGRIKIHDIDILYEVFFKELIIFLKNPFLVSLSWMKLMLSAYYSIIAKLLKSTSEKSLNSAQSYALEALKKRTQVAAAPASFEILSLGASMFLTVLIVLLFLIFKLFGIL